MLSPSSKFHQNPFTKQVSYQIFGITVSLKVNHVVYFNDAQCSSNQMCKTDLNSFPRRKLDETTGTSLLVLHGWKPFSRIWNPATLIWTMQLTWLRTIHSGDWCLRSALHTLSGACQKWWWWWVFQQPEHKDLSKSKSHVTCLVLVTYSSHDRQSFGGQKPWIMHFFIDDTVKHFFFIIPREWRLKSTNHSMVNKYIS